jgi:hypothetical protein
MRRFDKLWIAFVLCLLLSIVCYTIIHISTTKTFLKFDGDYQTCTETQIKGPGIEDAIVEQEFKLRETCYTIASNSNRILNKRADERLNNIKIRE